MDIPGVMDKTDSFFHRLSTSQKEEYKVRLEKWKLINKPNFLGRVHRELSSEYEHLEMVQACCRAFCGTDLAIKTGFHFVCAEPLIEFGGLQEGNKSFDLLLFNDTSKKAIFIECKSSISSVKNVSTEIEQSIQLVQKNKEYLSERIDDTISWDDCEYVLCIADKDSEKIHQSKDDSIQKNKSSMLNRDGFVIWIFHPFSKIAQISEKYSHADPVLHELLQMGTEKKSLQTRLDIPYCITSHPYIIIEQAVLGQCYPKQYAKRESIEDPKRITKNLMMNEMMKSISLVTSPSVKKDMVKRKLEEVVAYGLRYDLFADEDKESFRINCRGERTKTVVDVLKEKYIENWAVYEATIEARLKVEDEMMKTISQKEISDFGKK
ncbi:hypothetical protein KSK55_05845 [Methanospirillum purgamenti]|uniref:Uncharacterized protein n=1 Tax=Methanospirillum hungatei TaxID=2203 RepID=A0A8F5ZFI1_METHU|nr:hypothetical protein [Methanospirillum hungatei]QXO95907.1 hypothetical protein KSK55_05845 [Methanospirillum hungatei]